MGAQTIYTFNAQSGSAGGIIDLAPHETNTFINAMKTGDLHFGYGVFLGTTRPNNCVLPNIADGYGVTLETPADITNFLGVTVNNRSTELGHFQNAGQIVMHHGAGCGVMRWGRIYVHTVPKDFLAEDETSTTDPKAKRIKNGDKLYVVVEGDADMIGKFTNKEITADETHDDKITLPDKTEKIIATHKISKTLQVNGKFVSPVDFKANVAMIEIFNQSNVI